jgi:hypothetical protein
MQRQSYRRIFRISNKRRLKYEKRVAFKAHREIRGASMQCQNMRLIFIEAAHEKRTKTPTTFCHGITG